MAPAKNIKKDSPAKSESSSKSGSSNKKSSPLKNSSQDESKPSSFASRDNSAVAIYQVWRKHQRAVYEEQGVMKMLVKRKLKTDWLNVDESELDRIDVEITKNQCE